MQEIWKDSLIMVGYEVSNLGNVRHKERKINRKLQESRKWI